MKQAVLYFLTIPLLVFPFVAQAQNMSHEEEVVRNAYAKLSLMCSLPPLVTTGAAQLETPAQITRQDMAGRMAKTTPVFTLTDFKVGDISDIANDQWSNFVDFPQNGDYILSGGLITQGYKQSDNGTSWQMASVTWQRFEGDNPEAIKLIASQPVSEIIKLGAQQWNDRLSGSNPPIAYTRYAEFNVTASFQGRTTGPHKAIFLIGHDAHGKEFVAENDLFSGQNPLWAAVNQRLNLDGLLLGKIREAPVVAEWLRDNVMPASSCSTDPRVVCCDDGRCGVSPVTYNRELSVPFPAPKEQ